MNTSPTTEERIWAVLAHLSALAFGMGILLPIIGWSEQRRKSKYASFQCLQALGYQSIGYTAWLLSYLIVLIGALAVIVVMSYWAEKNQEPFDPLAGPTMVLVLVAAFGFLALYILLPIIAAIACALGRDFRYPIMGHRLAKYLGYQQVDGDSEWLIEAHEERWVAGMGHFTVIIFLWGLIAPVTTWILQGRRSAYLKFQSVQTSVYQSVVNVLFLGASFIYFIGFFALIATTGLAGNAGNMSSLGLFSFAIFIIFSLIAFVVFLAIPLFHILGQWAGYRVLKGDSYHYPLVGKLVEKRIPNKTNTALQPPSSAAGKTEEKTI